MTTVALAYWMGGVANAIIAIAMPERYPARLRALNTMAAAVGMIGAMIYDPPQ